MSVFHRPETPVARHVLATMRILSSGQIKCPRCSIVHSTGAIRTVSVPISNVTHLLCTTHSKHPTGYRTASQFLWLRLCVAVVVVAHWTPHFPLENTLPSIVVPDDFASCNLDFIHFFRCGRNWLKLTLKTIDFSMI